MRPLVLILSAFTARLFLQQIFSHDKCPYIEEITVLAERKRRHVPISYKAPEKQPSGTQQGPSAPDAAKPENRLDKKPSGIEGDALPRRDSGLESRPSDPSKTVSRTESGQKLSVFERLQR